VPTFDQVSNGGIHEQKHYVRLVGCGLAQATASAAVRISSAPDPYVKSGVDRLYVIDCGDGSGADESRWTPGVNVGTPAGFPGHCYLIHHTQGWVLWDTGIDDAVAQLPRICAH
jgi:N-acyl homoserine lactone hydrolase